MKKIDMTKGKILRILISIAIPLVLSNLMNMAYNFTDMYWVGKVGTESLSALGTAGLYIWLSAGVIMVSKVGTEIYLAQAVGRKDDSEIKAYAINGIKLGLLISFAYTFIVVVFRDQLINIFDLELVTAGFAKEYLIFGGIAIFFMMMNQLYMSVFQSLGNTKIIFLYISIGLVANMILDPLFILTFNMGVTGAAVATLIGSLLPFILFTIT
ncbi:MAG: MATE family efflux transporter, partial [Mycoplasmatales bacterium]